MKHRGCSEQTQKEGDAPKGVPDFWWHEAAQNAADSQDSAVDQDEYGQAMPKMMPPDKDIHGVKCAQSKFILMLLLVVHKIDQTKRS